MSAAVVFVDDEDAATSAANEVSSMETDRGGGGSLPPLDPMAEEASLFNVNLLPTPSSSSSSFLLSSAAAALPLQWNILRLLGGKMESAIMAISQISAAAAVEEEAETSFGAAAAVATPSASTAAAASGGDCGDDFISSAADKSAAAAVVVEGDIILLLVVRDAVPLIGCCCWLGLVAVVGCSLPFLLSCFMSAMRFSYSSIAYATRSLLSPFFCVTRPIFFVSIEDATHTHDCDTCLPFSSP